MVLQPPLNFGEQRAGRLAERAGEPRTAAHHAADQFLPLRSGGTEQHRLGVAFELVRDVGKIDWVGVGLELARRGDLINEAAQPEAVEIQCLCCPALLVR